MFFFQYKPPPIKKKLTPSQRSDGDSGISSSATRPAGSSVVKQNSNFSNTYSLTDPHYTSKTPTSQLSRPLASKSNTVVKKQQVSTKVEEDSPTDYINQSTITKSSGGRKQQLKTTSFSRVKRTSHHSPSSLTEDTITETNGTFNVPLHYQPKATKMESSSRQMTSASRRLFAALEYSDNSSDENSGHVGTNGHSNGGRVDRHRSQLNKVAVYKEPAAKQYIETDPR